MANGKFFNPANFSSRPCAVTFNSKVLGGTDGPVNISCEEETQEISCNQARGAVLQKIVTRITVTVKARFKEINNALGVLLENNSVSSKDLGTDRLNPAKAKTLVLSEIGGSRIITLPKAFIEKSFNYELDGEQDHGVELTFTAVSVPGKAAQDLLKVSNS